MLLVSQFSLLVTHSCTWSMFVPWYKNFDYVPYQR